MRSFKLNRLGLMAVIATAMFVFASQRASAVTIDDFTMIDHDATVTGNGTGSDSDTAGPIPFANTIGGYRSLMITVSSNPSSLSNPGTIEVSTGGFGTASLSLKSQVVGEAMLLWDANGAGLGGIDITNGGLDDIFQALVTFSDQDLVFKVDITDTGSNVATYSTNLGMVPPASGFIYQPLASFTNAGSTNFTSVDSIKLTLTGPNAQDATFTLLETTDTPGNGVPEPATMTLLGLAGLAMLRRRGAKA